MSFKPKRIEIPSSDEHRPTSAEIAATIGPLASQLIPTTPAPTPAVTQGPARSEPSLMMSFKASKTFAKMLAEAAEKEGGLRRLIARVFSEAGYPVPNADLYNQRKRRTYD